MQVAWWGRGQHGGQTVQQLTVGTRGVEGTPYQRGREMLVSTWFFCFIQPGSEWLEWSHHHEGWVSVIHLWTLQRFVSWVITDPVKFPVRINHHWLRMPFSEAMCLVMRHSPLIAYSAPNILQLHDYASSYRFLGNYKNYANSYYKYTKIKYL